MDNDDLLTRLIALEQVVQDRTDALLGLKNETFDLRQQLNDAHAALAHSRKLIGEQDARIADLSVQFETHLLNHPSAKPIDIVNLGLATKEDIADTRAELARVRLTQAGYAQQVAIRDGAIQDLEQKIEALPVLEAKVEALKVLATKQPDEAEATSFRILAERLGSVEKTLKAFGSLGAELSGEAAKIAAKLNSTAQTVELQAQFIDQLQTRADRIENDTVKQARSDRYALTREQVMRALREADEANPPEKKRPYNG